MQTYLNNLRKLLKNASFINFYKVFSTKKKRKKEHFILYCIIVLYLFSSR